MLLVEVLALESWFNEQEEKNGFYKNLNALQQVLNTNVQAQRNRNGPFQSFTDQKNSSIESLRGVDLSMLSQSQIKFLDIYGVLNYLNKGSASRLKKTFSEDRKSVV